MNIYLAMRYFGELNMTQLEFRKKLTFELIHNTLKSGTEEERPERRRNTRRNTLHKIITDPTHSGFEVGKWVKSASKITNSINMTLRDAQILLELCVTAQKTYFDATHVSRFTLWTPHHEIAISTEFSFLFLFLLFLIITAKLLIGIYSFLSRLIIEVI